MTPDEKDRMFLDLNSVLVKFWIGNGRPDKEIQIELLERMLNWYKKMGYATMDVGVEPKEEKKLPEGLEDAAAIYERENRCSVLGSVDIIDAFKAGAEWMAQKINDESYEEKVEDLYEDEEGIHCVVSVGTDYKPGEIVAVYTKRT